MPAEAGLFYAAEYYNNKTTIAGANLIQVGGAENLQGVDVSLAVGGIITGYVTSSWTNTPVSTWVYAYDSNVSAPD